jgi:thymidylate synthase
MRSSDAWLGIVYDLMNFSMLTNALAGRLGVLPGWLQLNLGSSHLYERDRKAALEVLNDWTSGETVMSPRLPGPPPIELVRALDGEEIQIEEPWQSYANCLKVSTGAEALEILRAITTRTAQNL